MKSEVRTPERRWLSVRDLGVRTSDFGLRTSQCKILTLANRQRARRVDMRLLRQVIRTLLEQLLQLDRFALGVYLVGAPEITRLNETFLRHQGPTDVIAFDYNEANSDG